MFGQMGARFEDTQVKEREVRGTIPVMDTGRWLQSWWRLMSNFNFLQEVKSWRPVACKLKE